MDGQYVMTHSLLQYLFYVFQNGTYTKFQDYCKLEYECCEIYNFLYLNLRNMLTLCVIIRLGVHFHYTGCILHNVRMVKIDGQIPTSLGLL